MNNHEEIDNTSLEIEGDKIWHVEKEENHNGILMIGNN